jgi:sialic acid synthase SpsE
MLASIRVTWFESKQQEQKCVRCTTVYSTETKQNNVKEIEQVAPTIATISISFSYHKVSHLPTDALFITLGKV